MNECIAIYETFLLPCNGITSNNARHNESVCVPSTAQSSFADMQEGKGLITKNLTFVNRAFKIQSVCTREEQVLISKNLKISLRLYYLHIFCSYRNLQTLHPLTARVTETSLDFGFAPTYANDWIAQSECCLQHGRNKTREHFVRLTCLTEWQLLKTPWAS